MKKSLLVVPALGVMLLAAAGSVGGTVAWFSSVSSIKLDKTSFQVTRLDGNLSLEMTEGPGTDVTNSAKTVKTKGNLTHASFDHVNTVLSTISSEATSGLRSVGDFTTANYVETAGSKWLARDYADETDVYWAVSWKMKFSYSFAAEKAVDLFFDSNSVAATDGTGDPSTKPGFRLAIIGTGKGSTTGNEFNTVIWAPFRTQTDASNMKYVASTDITSGNINSPSGTYTYAADNANRDLFLSDFTGDSFRLSEGTLAATHDKTKGYLGTIKKGVEAQNFIEFTVVAWFEGTDAAITGSPADADMANVTADLKFYTREYTGS